MDFNATFLICAISFIVFVFIMNQILYKPMAKIVEKREGYIRSNELAADADNQKAQAIIQDKEEKIELANKNAGKIILDKSNSAKEESKNILLNAQDNFKQTVENNKNILMQEKQQAKEKMADEIQNMANSIAAKILKEGA